LPRALGALAALALAFGLSAAASPSARGDTLGYGITVSSDYSLATSPGNGNVQLQAKGLSAHVLATEANNPVFEITNNAMTSGITSIVLTLNDPESTFEAFKILSPTTGDMADAPFTVNAFNGPSDTVGITFSTPLAPGASTFFMAELGPANGFSDVNWTPGYQSILWKPGEIANLNVTWNDTADPTDSISQALPALTDFMNNVNSFTVVGCCGNTSLLTDIVTGPLPPPTPEPASVVLLLLGAIPAAVPVWRKRRQLAASRG